jgi:hypothetical protein
MVEEVGWMSSIRAVKVGVISAATAFALLIGGFVISGSLAGAQTPPPVETPAPSTVPADPGTTPRGDKECDHDKAAPSGSSASPSSSSSSGVRYGGFRQ